MIKIKYDALADAVAHMMEITKEAMILTDPLKESMGVASNTEREIIELLIKICDEDLPYLTKVTGDLLEVIRKSFEDSETKITSIYNEAKG